MNVILQDIWKGDMFPFMETCHCMLAWILVGLSFPTGGLPLYHKQHLTVLWYLSFWLAMVCHYLLVPPPQQFHLYVEFFFPVTFSPHSLLPSMYPRNVHIGGGGGGGGGGSIIYLNMSPNSASSIHARC